MRHALVFGATGQIGRPLLAGLSRAGWWVTAVSRDPQPDRPGLAWLQGDFSQLPALPEEVDAIFSCGPLDAFARWYATSPVAKRWGRFPLPRNALGLRQPVHVEDLAQAALACADAATTHGHAYALPGGEALPYREMVARVLATLQPPPRLVELPSPLFTAALLAAQLVGKGTGLGEAAVRRMRSDLVFDAAPAMRDFGYTPRAFQPAADMFDPRPGDID